MLSTGGGKIYFQTLDLRSFVYSYGRLRFVWCQGIYLFFIFLFTATQILIFLLCFIPKRPNPTNPCALQKPITPIIFQPLPPPKPNPKPSKPNCYQICPKCSKSNFVCPLVLHHGTLDIDHFIMFSLIVTLSSHCSFTCIFSSTCPMLLTR